MMTHYGTYNNHTFTLSPVRQPDHALTDIIFITYPNITTYYMYIIDHI